MKINFFRILVISLEVFPIPYNVIVLAVSVEAYTNADFIRNGARVVKSNLPSKPEVLKPPVPKELSIAPTCSDGAGVIWAEEKVVEL